MWTKGDLVAKAFEENSLAGFNFDIDPDEKQATCVTLDAMMAEWDGRGIRIGYPLADGPDGSNLSDATYLPAYAVAPVYMNLAKRMAASNGKALSNPQLEIANSGLKLLLSKAAMPGPTVYPNSLPRGAGNRRSWANNRAYFPTPDTSPLQNSSNGNLDILED
jgi:hypothetical protein